MNARIHFAKILASAALALAFASAGPASAVDVTFDVQPQLLNLGETATATLTFHGVRSAPASNSPRSPASRSPAPASRCSSAPAAPASA
jgi:hypothetical protein